MNNEIIKALEELDAQLEPIGDNKFRIGITLPRDSLVMFYGAVNAEKQKLTEEPEVQAVLGDMLKMLGKKIGIWGAE